MSHAPPAGSIELNLERNDPGGWDIPGSFPKIHTTRELDTTIPAIAKSPNLMSDLDEFLRSRSTSHDLVLADSRFIDFLPDRSIHLVVTSPPYWTLKTYNSVEGQLGHVEDYEQFLKSLDRVWQIMFDALVPGGRMVCVVGDVCLSRRRNGGEHTCVPLHASIQERCRRIGFSNLAPIIWHKIANASYEVEGNSRFLGKPYEPNGVIKNDIEYILMLRKPGGYRKPAREARLLSVIGDADHKVMFQQIWSDITGASTRHHPAPYPIALANRLIRMFSFVGDVVVDPFMGSGTTNIAAALAGRNSIGIELDHDYFALTRKRFSRETQDLFSRLTVNIHDEHRKLYA